MCVILAVVVLPVPIIFPMEVRQSPMAHAVDSAVFEDDLALTRPDPEARNEPRFVTVGVDGFGRHLVVVFTERGSRIRLISARVATKQERKFYEG